MNLAGLGFPLSSFELKLHLWSSINLWAKFPMQIYMQKQTWYEGITNTLSSPHQTIPVLKWLFLIATIDKM